jgi:hypothetical protein
VGCDRREARVLVIANALDKVNDRERTPMGMSAPGAEQDAQFLLDVMHWLSGLLGDT